MRAVTLHRRLIPAFFVLVAAAAPALRGDESSAWELVVLGIAQDGGMPHPGCTKPPCVDVRAGRRRAEKVSCVGLVNRETGAAYMIDATPDFPAQLHALTGGRPPDGILLTHAHIGHYTGLMYLGKEAMAARAVPVYGTGRMIGFLRDNAPWSALVADGRVEPRELTPDRAVELPGGLRVTPMLVPHRDEFSDTIGFLIEGPRSRVLFIPDIDKWERWNRSLRELAGQVDVLLLDGTFSSLGELPGRSIEEVRHPLMSETRQLVTGTNATLWFIHLNHSNPEIAGGWNVAKEGQRFRL
jgi:pyrroloquinoline quinone biosynthesis protein B